MSDAELDRLTANVENAREALHKAEKEFETYVNAQPVTYSSLDNAQSLRWDLLEKASDDCEGSYNCGEEFYTKDFYVDGVLYEGRLDVEYNRHDKRYYFVDSHEFSYRIK